MGNTTRRGFMANAGKAAVAGGLLSFTANQTPDMIIENKFIHHVYFWLKNPESKEDRAKLIAGLKKMATIKTIQVFHIGQPAPTNRDVIERSYAISWFTLFNNAADQESYQKDPIHLQFIADCASLWSKVVVYDSIDA